MKHFTKDQVNDMIKLRFGGLVNSLEAKSYTSYGKLGKVFGCSGQHVRRLIVAKFEEQRMAQLPLIEQMKQ